MSSPTSMESYSWDIVTCLSAVCKVAKQLVQEHRAYHCELINSRCPDPHTYSVGNIVFACHATQSDALKGCVDKLAYIFNGPWHITTILRGALFELKHCSTPHRKEKKHASNLSPYPLELIPFQQLDGSKIWYGQLHKSITAPPFKEAGINGFGLIQPFKISANFLTADQVSEFHWPSLLELNEVQRLGPILDRCFYPDLGNTIAGSCCLIIAMHSSCTSMINAIPQMATISTHTPTQQFHIGTIQLAWACKFFRPQQCRFW